jgi:hypothetical protein
MVVAVGVVLVAEALEITRAVALVVAVRMHIGYLRPLI